MDNIWCKPVVALLLVAVTSLSASACYGGQALGMGGAFTSLAEGTQAIYWNQAGLAFSGATQVGFEVSRTYTYPQDKINYNDFSAAMVRYGQVAVGFGLTYLAPWAGNEVWETVAFAYRVNPELAVGGAIRQVSPTRTTGHDLSLQCRRGIYRFGVLYQDINGGSPDNPWYLKNLRPSFAIETDTVTLAFDCYLANNLDNVFAGERQPVNHQVGLEYRPFGQAGPFALRGGFYHGYVTAGVGVKVGPVFVDLAHLPQLEATQVTAGIRF